MDDFGFKPHRKSASLAELKSMRQTKPISNNSNGVPPNPMPDFVAAGLDDIFYTQKENTCRRESTPATYGRRSNDSSSPAHDPFSVNLQPPGWPFTESDWLHPNKEINVQVRVHNSVDVELDRLQRATKFKKQETLNTGTPTTSISIPQQLALTIPFPLVFGGSFPWGKKPASSTSAPNSHMRTQERMANALAEKKQRDVQILQEQEERSRLAETLDQKIKRWASGKEGNVRALLSSMQDILWPQSGWQMMASSTTDLKESKSVKKVYHRAIMYLHPDKAKQKGFSPQERYIAEKVFYLLMEAYKVFEAKELS